MGSEFKGNNKVPTYRCPSCKNKIQVEYCPDCNVKAAYTGLEKPMTKEQVS